MKIAQRALEIAVAQVHIGVMDALTLQLLTFIAERPRTYGEVMEAWHTACPRMPVWEDAISDGLVRLDGHGTMRERSVRLTARGREMLGDSEYRLARRMG
jgi:hypothetical protein